jgi:hypothetical protein
MASRFTFGVSPYFCKILKYPQPWPAAYALNLRVPFITSWRGGTAGKPFFSTMKTGVEHAQRRQCAATNPPKESGAALDKGIQEMA